MANTLVGVFDNYSNAQSALNELLQCGFDRDDVRLTPSEEGGTHRESVLRGAEREGVDTGWSIGSFFRSLFGADDDDVLRHSDMYSEAVRRGSYLVTVDADSDEEEQQAADILNRFQPVDVEGRAEHWRSQGWSGFDSAAPMYSDDEVQRDRTAHASPQDQNLRGGTLEGEARIPVVEEQMKVGKREVQRGGVRVFQRVTEKPVDEEVRLREEHVKVERHAVDQPASSADLDALKEGAIEMRETAEEAVVDKTARVVEEVLVSKETTERTEHIKDTVRRTDVDVEQLGSEAGRSAMGRTQGTGMGTTADSMGATSAGMDDSDFRTHWQTSYGQQGGRYEDYEPAYRYGSTMAGNEKYRGSQWNDVEPQIRTDWESNNAGTPWERAKDAVRYGWEKVTR